MTTNAGSAATPPSTPTTPMTSDPATPSPATSSTTTVTGPTGPGRPARAVSLGGAGLGTLMAMVSVAIFAVLAAGGFSGAFAALAGFADPGAIVRYGVPVLTVLAELTAAITVASLFLAATILPGAPARQASTVAAWAAVTWTILALAQSVLRYALISGTSPSSPAFGTELATFSTTIPLGRNYLAVIIVAAATSTAAFAVRGPTGRLWTTVLAASALALQANTGHAAGAASHELAISSLFMHLMGAALWIGGLVTLAVVHLRGGFIGGFIDGESGPRGRPAGLVGAHRAGKRGTGRAGVEADSSSMTLGRVLGRYSAIAGWCYLVVAVSGLVSASIRIGALPDLGTDYGILLIAKVVLLGVLGLFGLLHRRHVIGKLTTGASSATRSAVALFWRLAGVELLIMGAVSGIAVALSSTAPPIPQTPFVNPTPAQLVTGHGLPPEPTLLRWFTQWRWDLLFAFGCVAAIVVYLRWVRRLGARGDAWPVGRTISWCIGMVLLFWVTNGGPAMYGHVLFSSHMIQHMLLVMIIPIFLVLGAPITLLVRAIPARKDGTRGGREWILAVVHSKWGRAWANPVVAAVNFAGSMILFYYTLFFELALTTYIGHVVMVVHFTLAGYMFANALVGIDPGPTRPAYPQRLLLLFATMAFHAFFGVTLMNSETLLVPTWFGLLGRTWGPSAIVDQQTGAGITWGIGELPTLILAIVVAVMWARADDREAKRRDRRADRDGDVELDQYNAMLASMAAHDAAAQRDAAE